MARHPPRAAAKAPPSPRTSASDHSSSTCLTDSADCEEVTRCAPFECRVCLREQRTLAPPADPGAALVAPCRCAGTQRHVHVRCLRRWQEAVQRRDALDDRAWVCSVCRTPFSLPPAAPRWRGAAARAARAAAAGAALAALALGAAGPPWPHLAALALLAAGGARARGAAAAALLAGAALAGLHARGLHLTVAVEAPGRHHHHVQQQPQQPQLPRHHRYDPALAAEAAVGPLLAATPGGGGARPARAAGDAWGEVFEEAEEEEEDGAVADDGEDDGCGGGARWEARVRRLAGLRARALRAALGRLGRRLEGLAAAAAAAAADGDGDGAGPRRECPAAACDKG